MACLSCRLSLGIPSSLLMSALELATRCIREVVPEAGVGARVVMEAGYIVLGAMCVALPQDIMDVSQCRQWLRCNSRVNFDPCEMLHNFPYLGVMLYFSRKKGHVSNQCREQCDRNSIVIWQVSVTADAADRVLG
jgi:hypothetical protein